MAKPDVFSVREFLLPAFYRDVFIELLVSTFLLMFITFSLTSLNSDAYKPGPTHIGLMVGLVIYLLIEAYGHFSGAHMNPVVSFAFCIEGRITFARAFMYTVAQCIGGTLGSGIVYGLCPPSIREAFQPFAPAPSIGVPQGLIVELIFTFNLVFVAISTSDHRTHNVMLPSLPTAFCVGTAIMATGTWTGACLNPIVALGLAVISKNFSNHWIYWVANYTGSLLAVIVYKVYRLLNKQHGDPLPTRDDSHAGDVMLKGERTKDEISELLEKIIRLASQRESNENHYRNTKSSQDEGQ